MQPPQHENGDGQAAHQQPGEAAQPRRKRGRPPKTPEQRHQDQERRIPASFKGRLKFRPGDPHALDVQLKEARNFRLLIMEQISQLHRMLTELESQDDLSVQISREEGALKAFLWETYREHKHRDHILASFIAIRRQRLLARLEAARNALELARELLAPDDRILRDLRHAVEQAKAHAREQARQPLQPDRQEAVHQEELEDHRQAPAESTQDEQQTAEPEEEIAADQQEAAAEASTTVDHRHIYGDADALRAQLTAFDERVKQMRAAISAGVGWFEEYYIYKERLTYEARQYIIQGKEPPEGIQLTETVVYGPYLKWRIRESGIKNAPIITVQMGRIPDDELIAEARRAAQGDQEKGEPWPPL